MAKLYYGTDEFEVPEFANRRVIDEINISMSAFDCVLPDDAGIYCSSDITTGKKFYYEVLGKYEVRSEEELKEQLGTEEFKKAYAKRAGIEGTLSQGVRMGDLRRTRYIGLPKTRLLHLLIATALNVVRIAAWLAEIPLAQIGTPGAGLLIVDLRWELSSDPWPVVPLPLLLWRSGHPHDL